MPSQARVVTVTVILVTYMYLYYGPASSFTTGTAAVMQCQYSKVRECSRFNGAAALTGGLEI
jgi:hypothetical protein